MHTPLGAGRRILLVAETWGVGGIESFALDEVESLAPRGCSFTLFAPWKWDVLHDAKLESLGVDAVFCFEVDEPSLVARYLRGWRRFNGLLKREKFDVVHVNAMNGASLVYAHIAKRHGVPVVVAHSRNTRYGGGHLLAKAIAHGMGKAIGNGAADVRLACSEDAGRFLFGGLPFTVVRRGLDTHAFAFDEDARNRVRDELGIPLDALVVGNVGRVSEAKNPLFQVEVFDAFHDMVPGSVLLLVGDGDMRAARDEQIEQRGLGAATRIVDATTDPAPYYSAMDCLIMPSRYEGLPNVALEAQCSGLPVLLSDGISPEARVTSLVRALALSAGAQAWAKGIDDVCGGVPSDRGSFAIQLERAGFSSDGMRTVLEEAYGLA